MKLPNLAAPFTLLRGAGVPPAVAGLARSVGLAAASAGILKLIQVLGVTHLSASQAAWVPTIIMALRVVEGILDQADAAKALPNSAKEPS